MDSAFSNFSPNPDDGERAVAAREQQLVLQIEELPLQFGEEMRPLLESYIEIDELTTKGFTSSFSERSFEEYRENKDALIRVFESYRSWYDLLSQEEKDSLKSVIIRDPIEASTQLIEHMKTLEKVNETFKGTVTFIPKETIASVLDQYKTALNITLQNWHPDEFTDFFMKYLTLRDELNRAGYRSENN